MTARPRQTEAAEKPIERMPVDLVATGLRVAYERDVEILRGIEITAAARRITLVIGPNGAGKSTFLKAVAGLAPVTGGRVTLGGADITGWRPRELLGHGVALVPQNGTLFPAMTVRENLQMGGWLRRREKAWLGESIEAVINRFNLPRHLVDRRAGDLSGGQ
ncbi:MAG TPA: ATP-binding cassette domain-containing protein, partial [Nordella sp.]|nr:ATP-binding cassette domain-containing protein [Nordella sp.]